MRFFFYGTLIDGSPHPVARAAHAKLRGLGPATVRGRLHAIPDPAGWYPALLPGEGVVHGRSYETTADFGPADLAALDRWEDFDPGRPAASLYRREGWTASGGAQSFAVQAYRFNQALPAGARSIADGHFHAWLDRERLRAFR